MKRPLCFAAAIITAIVFLYLELFLSDHLYDHSENQDGNYIELTGIVSSKEYRSTYMGDMVPVIYVTPTDRSIGKNKYIQCYMGEDGNGYSEPFIGEHVRLKGKVKQFNTARNPGEFDSRLYYSTLKIAYSIRNCEILAKGGRKSGFHESLYHIRLKLEKVLDTFLDIDDSAIMKAVLLGDKAYMDQEVKDLYKNSGIIHILAVSGLHVGILGMGIHRALRKCKIPVLPSAFTAIVLMYMYGEMCSMSASAFRAIAMFSLKLLAPVFKRTYDMLTALAVAEIMLLIDQPLLLYNSGFLFSFGAILGIAVVKPAFYGIEDRLFHKSHDNMRFADDPDEGIQVKLFKGIIEGLISSFSIFLVTLPVYMNFYYTFPIYSFFLNLIVLPMMAPLMILGLICLGIGALALMITEISGGLLFIASIPVIPAGIIHLVLWIYRTLCELSMRLPGKTLYLGHATGATTIAYVILLSVFVFLSFCIKSKDNKAINAQMVIGNRIGKETLRYVLLLAAFVIITFTPVRGLNITMIDVDQGDGILLRTGKEKILIDGGSTGKKNVGKYSIKPYLLYEGIGTLDAVIITHEDSDHISGVLELMDDMGKGGIRIKHLILPDVSAKTRGDNYHKLENRAKELHIPISYISCGQKLAFSDLKLTCLNPVKGMRTEGANAYSTVLYLEYRDFTALFTGDVEEEGQKHLLEDLEKGVNVYNNLDMLKVAHHGSKYTTDERFLDILKPKVALISCGIDNSYGHPHKELLDRLESVGARIYRTDESGAIKVSVVNEQISVKKYLGK